MSLLHAVSCLILPWAVSSTSVSIAQEEASVAARGRPASGKLTTVLGLDDVCHRAAEAAGEGLAGRAAIACALGAVQQSARAKLAAPLLTKPVANQSRAEPSASDGSIALLSSVSAVVRSGQPEDLPDANVGAPVLPGPQFPHSGRHPNGWKVSQERWIAQGDTVPEWAEMPEVTFNGTITRERASIMAPIGGGVLLILCIVCLVICQGALGKNMKEGREKTEEQPATAGQEAGGAASLLRSAEKTAADSRLPQGEKSESDGQPVTIRQLFRFATPWDICCVVVAAIMASVHGILMPIAFYHMDSMYQCLYFPNDDGTVPPTPGAHTIRDAKVWHVVRIYGFAGLTIGIARAMSVLLMSRAAKRQGRAIRSRVFEKLLRQGPAWHDEHDPAEMSLMVSSDTYFFQCGISEKLLDQVRAVLLTFSALSMASYKDWKVTLVMVIAMPVSALAMMISLNVFQKTGVWQLSMYSKAGGIAENAMMLIRTVYAFGGQGRELKNYGEKLKSAALEGNRLGLVSGFCFGVNNAVLCFALCLGLYSGATWIVEGWEKDCWRSEPPFGTCKTGGSMMACIFTVMWGFTMGLGTISISMEGIAKARSAAQRIYAIIDAPIKQLPGGRVLEHVEGHVVFDSVDFSYKGREAAPTLVDVSLRIPAGTTCALVGPSGSGKSTMVNLLLRFYQPQSGSILLDGQDIQGLQLDSLRSKMALVEQEPVLFGTTILENITFGCHREVSKEEVERAATMANAHSFIASFSEKYKTQVGSRGTQLSGGQKQRIAIARALLRDPTILLLDEATSALDSNNEQLVQDALDKLMQSKRRTTLVIAHRLSTIRDADKIAVFQEGRLAEEGTHRELLSSRGAYTKLVKAQFDVEGEMGDDENEDDIANSPPYEASPASTQDYARQLTPPATSPGPRALEATPKGEEEKQEARAKPSNTMGRLCEESRPDFYLYGIGVLALSAGSVLVPMYMLHFAQTLNLFNRPPAVLDPETKTWIADYDEGEVMHNVTVLCIFMQICGIAVIFVNVISFYCFNRAAESLLTRLRQKAFRSILCQEMAWHDQNAAGTLAGQLAEQIPKLKLLVGNGLASGVNGFLGVFVGLGMAFLFSWRFALCVIGALPVLGFGTCLVVFANQYENENLFGGLVSEALNSIKTVSAYGLQQKLMVHFKQHLDKQAVGEHAASWFFGVGNGITVGGIFLLLGMNLMVANIFVNHNLMSQDRAMVVFFGIFGASMSAGQATVWLSDRSTALKAVDDVFEIMDREPAIDSMDERGQWPQQVSPLGCKIELQDVHFFYPSRPESKVFQGLNLVLEPNTTTALVGPSGSGKSTTVGLLQRFYDPSSGVIRFNGADIRELNLGYLRSQMGLVQQEPVLFTGSILENIRYGNEKASDEQIVNAARAANAHAFICKLPLQYGTEVGSKGQALSGGQKQRIAIARALVRDPALLLLDEATAALDAVSERQVQDALDELLQKQSRTTLVIAHRLMTIQGADQICVMHLGKVVQKGTHQELIADRSGLYAKLVGCQQLKVQDAETIKPLK